VNHLTTNRKYQNIFIFLISILTGFILYILPMINISLGYDTWWIFIIQSSPSKLLLPNFYNHVGIESGNIISSGIALFEYFGRINFLDWARFWILAKYFPDNPIIWRLVSVSSMSISLIYWVKIYKNLSISNISIVFVYIFLLTDPQSLWLDWNKSESLAFLFFSVSAYYISLRYRTKNYLACLAIIISILIKETFIVAIPFLIFLNIYVNHNVNKQSLHELFKYRLISYFSQNKHLIIFGILYSILCFMLFFLDFEKSYVFDNNIHKYSITSITNFIFAFIKLLIPIHFHELLNIDYLFLIMGVFVATHVLIIIRNKFFEKFEMELFCFKDNQDSNKFEFYILPVCSIIAMFCILFFFGSIERRYAAPINIITLTSLILFSPILKSIFYKNNKLKNLYPYLPLYIYVILSLPFFILISKISMITSIIGIFLFLIILVLHYQKSSIFKAFLNIGLIFIFLIPTLDRTFINIFVTRDIYQSWDQINNSINRSIPNNSSIEIELSDQVNIEQAVSLEIKSITQNRKDIVYYIDEAKAKQIQSINNFDFWHIQLFNSEKVAGNKNTNYILSLQELPSNSGFNQEKNWIYKIVRFRYEKYIDRYRYVIYKSK